MATPDPFEQFREDAANNISAANRELLDTVDISKQLDKEFKNVSGNLRNAYNNSTNVRDSLNSTLDLVSKLGREYVDADKITERILENRTKLQGVEANIKTLYEAEVQAYIGIGNTRAQAVALLGDEKQMYDNILARMTSNSAALRANVSAQEKEYVNLMNQVEGRKVINDLLDEAKDKVEGFNQKAQESTIKATALSKIFGSMSGIPFLKDFMDFKQLSVEFQKGFGSGMKNLGTQLKSIISNPLFLAAAGVVALITAFKALVKLAFDYDKLVTDIANNTALSKTSAVGLLDAYRDVSNENAKTVDSLNAGFLSVKNQANAFIELGETLETNAMFTNDMVQNQILLTKQMKMSKEEATGIQKLSLLTGQSAEKILNTAMKQNTSVISYKKIFSEIAKVNSEIATAYKNNPELIAKAVVEANKLGMSLEQTKNISKSLLDFETSISGELESELLLGKRFNFEKARALALDGKSVEAASELMGQIGGINALTQMNVIQRERLAASIGMSAEELTKSAREQAVLNALGEQNKAGLEERYEYLRMTGDLAGMEQLKAEAARKEGGQALLQDIARANLQDRFNESMERIKQIFTEIAAGPMIKLLSGFAQLMEHTTLLKVLFFSLATAATAIAASMVIASGGTVLLGAAAAVAATGIGLGLMGGSAAGEEDMAVAKPTLPNRNNNFPSYNNNNQGGYNNNNNQNTGNNQGNGAAGNQRSDEQRRIEIYTTLNMDGKDVSKVMKTSEYTYS
jgi:hypothetical protein